MRTAQNIAAPFSFSCYDLYYFCYYFAIYDMLVYV